ncbi:MAG: hypothetical protein E6Q58_02510 [Niabella sp.]|nr:MAG: hypothetical protein E6Q58_02510 [Niabella sp.]
MTLPKHINQCIADNKLTKVKVLRVPDKGLRRSYMILCKDSREKLYCVKIFASTDKKAKERFMEEALITVSIRRYMPVKYKSWIPQVVKKDLKSENPYFITKFVEGISLSNFLEDMGIERGMFNHENFPIFIEFFGRIQNLGKMKTFADISSWGGRNIRKELNYYLPVVKNLLSDQTYDNITQFLDSESLNLYKEFYVTSHRDLYPENILIKERFSKKFTFLDWEYFSHVPLGFDAAFLFLLFWREEFWKAKTYAFFENLYRDDKEKHKAFVHTFKVCLVILGIRFLYQIKNFGEKSHQEHQHFVRTIIYDIEDTLNGVTTSPRNIKFYLNENDLKLIAKEFRLGALKDYEIFYASKGNAVVRADCNEKSYIFRFYGDSRSVDLIMRELRIFKKLRENGIKTYTAYKNKNGNLLHKIELYGKVRRVAVLSFLEGKKIQKQWADETSALELGRTLRKIHDCNVVHGDFSKENVLYSRNKICAVIDFEWGKFTRLKNMKFHDLGRTLSLWITDIRYKKLDDRVFCLAVLKGYFGNTLTLELLNKIKRITIEKINQEKEIYFTTLDHMNSKPITRFEKSVESIRNLELYNKP